jgi:hypothetical protein
MNIDKPETRLAIKRFLSLIRWCERKRKPLPHDLAIAEAIEVDLTFFESIVYTLRREKIIKVVGGYAGHLHYRMVES